MRFDRIDLVATIVTGAALAALLLPDAKPAEVVPLVVVVLVVARIIALGVAWAAGWFGRKPMKWLENS
jgi:hypothetical protein